MKDELYIYGSNHPAYKSKIHIVSNATGNSLCGVKIIWGECTAVIISSPDFGKTIYTIPFGKSVKNIPFPERQYGWEFHSCKKCSKKLKELLKTQ